jgi:hypothetical protein
LPRRIVSRLGAEPTSIDSRRRPAAGPSAGPGG